MSRVFHFARATTPLLCYRYHIPTTENPDIAIKNLVSTYPNMNMVLKRKRSSLAFSPSDHHTPGASQSWPDNTSQIPLFFPQSKPDTSRAGSGWKPYQDPESPHLNSRTQKRHRDNRPDEWQIHSKHSSTPKARRNTDSRLQLQP